MLISSPSAGDPYAAAAALDRQLRSSGNDASGKLSGTPTLADMGANASDSLARATEADGGNDATTASDGADDVPVGADEDAAVAA